MKPVCLLCTFVLSVALTAWPQTSPAPSTHPKTSPKKTAAHPAAKGAVSKTSASTKKGPAKASAAASKSSKKSPATTNYRRGQLTPTTDRYREIQQALSDRGYLKNEPNGVWDQQSSDALKQFQAENNLTPTGKLSSLSLIQLGLGPKHDSVAFPPVAAELPPEPEPLPPPPLPAN